MAKLLVSLLLLVAVMVYAEDRGDDNDSYMTKKILADIGDVGTAKGNQGCARTLHVWTENELILANVAIMCTMFALVLLWIAIRLAYRTLKRQRDATEAHQASRRCICLQGPLSEKNCCENASSWQQDENGIFFPDVLIEDDFLQPDTKNKVPVSSFFVSIPMMKDDKEGYKVFYEQKL